MKPAVRFTWNMLYDCNYRCAYCFFEGKWEEYRKRNLYFSPGQLRGFWERAYKKYGSVYLVITGGEPFIYPNFIEIIKNISEFCFHINISSNSSGDLKSFVEEINPQKVSLSLSYHPQFDSLDSFIERLFFIRRHKFNGCVNFAAYPAFLKDIPLYREKFSAINEELKVIPFFGEYRGKIYPESYTLQEQKIIGIDGSWFAKVKRNGAMCQAGHKTALIFPDGKVARCGQVGENVVVSNFFDDNFKLLDSSSPCPAEYCPCDEGEVLPPEDAKAESENMDKHKEVTIETSQDSSGAAVSCTKTGFPGRELVSPPACFRKDQPNRVFLAWDISQRCNYNCSYCCVHGPLIDKDPITIDVAKARQISSDIYKRYSSAHIRFSGGEPFVYSDFIDLLSVFSEYHTLEVSTNLSMDVRKIKEKLPPETLLISSSFHPEFANFDEFLKKVLFLKENKFDVSVTCVAYPALLKQVVGYKESFEKNGVQVIIQLFSGEFNNKKYPDGYTREEKNLLQDCIDKSSSRQINNTIFQHKTNSHVDSGKDKKEKICRMGQMYAKIDRFGDIFRCCAKESPKMGNILGHGLELLNDPANCEIDNCPCWKAMIVGDEQGWIGKWEYPRHQKLYLPVQEKMVLAIEQPLKDDKVPVSVPQINFTWDSHYKCNFRCPYCWFYEGWVDGGKRNIYLSVEEWMRHWKRIYSCYGKCHIAITGGEPFLYPNFIPLIKELSQIHSVKVTTNMSGDIATFVKEIDPQKVILDLNFHPLFSTLDTYIKKTQLLKKAGFKAGVCYLAYPPQMKQIDTVKRRFENEGINFALAAFWGEYEGRRYPDSYSQEDRDMIRPFLGDIDRITYHLKGQSPKGKLCNAGHKYAVIQADGKVIRCGPLADKIIGSFFDEEFRLLDSPKPCEAETCPCNEYVNLLEAKDT